jgi:EAL and modified HD-GYP domain-containing signal transduction protein
VEQQLPPANPTRMVHVGRQPVYDRGGAVIGYELLFRADEHALGAGAHGTEGDLGTRATSQVIVNAFTEFGLDRLVGTRLAFINLTRDFLVGDLEVPFEPGSAVLEILETVEVDEQVYAGVKSLVAQGYAIALDDFVWGSGHERLLPLASYVKLDTLDADPGALAAAVAACRAYPGVQLIAERVETEADVELARQLGFELFQGYALGRPQVISVEALSPSRLRWMQLLGHLTSPDIELTEVSALVREDASLSYRVLRALNSASVGLGRKVSSVHDAIVLLGPARLRQWLSLMVLSDSAQATEEQLTSIMTRARLCQIVATTADLSGDAAFTVGLLSGISDRLGVPLIELLARLPLEASVMDALVRGRGRFGVVLGAVRAYEAGTLTADDGLPGQLDLTAAYLAAVDWAVRTCESALVTAS